MSNFNECDYEIRIVNEDDAEFIVGLRTNPLLSSYINPTSESIDDQKRWIREYKLREIAGKELFFVFCEDGIPKGTYRLSNINSISFTSGSWIFVKTINRLLPKIADLIMNDFGFRVLQKQVLLFNIRKDNERVTLNQSYKNPICYTESDTDYYYIVTSEIWKTGKPAFMKRYGIEESSYEKGFDCLEYYYNSLKLSSPHT